MGEPGAGRRILIVDDDFFITDMLGEDLAARGYEVSIAANARVLGRVMESYPPDLILLDIMLPGMDGTEIGHLLGVNPLTAGIPILVLSADRRIAEKAARVAAQGWIAKPFDLETLATHIAEVLAQHPR